MHPLKAMAAAAVAVTMTGLSGIAGAETVEETYVRYHSAIEAAEQCLDYRFRQEDSEDPEQQWIGEAQSRMSAYIDAQVGYAIGAGDRLHLIERAKGETDAYISEHTCEDPYSIELVTLFQTELEPLLPPR
jgi:NADH:ubiquinone oxidoreductase subunit D